MQAEMKTVNLKGRDYEQGYFFKTLTEHCAIMKA